MTAQKIPDDIERWEKKGLREDIDTDAEHVHDIYIWHSYAIEHEKCDCGGEYKDKGHWNPYAIVDGHPVKLNKDYFDTFEEAVGYLKGMIKDKEIVDGGEAEDEDEEEPEIPKHPDGDNVTRKGFDMGIHMAMMNGEDGAMEAYMQYVEDLKRATLDDFTGDEKKKDTKESKSKSEGGKADGEKSKKTKESKGKKTKEETAETKTSEEPKSEGEKKSKFTPEEQAEIDKMHERNNARIQKELAEERSAQALAQERKDREAPYLKEKAKAEEELKEQHSHGTGMVPRDDVDKRVVDQTGDKTAEATQLEQNHAKDKNKQNNYEQGGNSSTGILPGSNAIQHDNHGGRHSTPDPGKSYELGSYKAIPGKGGVNSLAGKGRRNDNESYTKNNGTILGVGPQEVEVKGFEQAQNNPWYIRVGDRSVPTTKYLRSKDNKEFLKTKNLLRTMTEYNRMAHDPQYQGRLAKIYDDVDDAGQLRGATLDDLGRMSSAQIRHMFAQMFQHTDPDTGERAWDGRHVLLPGGFQFAKTVSDPNLIDESNPDSRYIDILKRDKSGFNPSIFAWFANDEDTLDRRGMGLNKNALGLVDYKVGGVKGARQAKNIVGREDELSHVFGKDRQTPTDLILKLLGDAMRDIYYGGDDQEFEEEAMKDYILDNFGLPINKDDDWRNIMGAYQKALGMNEGGESNLPPEVRSVFARFLPKKYPALKDGSPTEMMSQNDALQALRAIYEGLREKKYGGYSMDSAYDEYSRDQAGLGLTPEGLKAKLEGYMTDSDGNQLDIENAKRKWAMDHLEDARRESIIDAVEPWIVNWLDNIPYNDAVALFKEYPELRRNMAMSPDERTDWYRNLADFYRTRGIDSSNDDESALRQIRNYHRKYWEPILPDDVRSMNDKYENYSGVNRKRAKSAGQLTARGGRKPANKPKDYVLSDEEKEHMGGLVGSTHSGTNHVEKKKDDKGEADYRSKHHIRESMKERVRYFDPYFDTLMNKGDEEGGEKKMEGIPSGEHDSNPQKARYRTVGMGEGKDASWPMKVVDKNTGKVLFTLGDRD